MADIKIDARELRKDLGGLRDETRKEFVEARKEIGGLRDEMRKEFVEVRKEIGGLRDEMHNEFGGLRDEMRKGFAELHKELAANSKAIVQGDLTTRIWMLLLCAAMLGVMARGLHWI